MDYYWVTDYDQKMKIDEQKEVKQVDYLNSYYCFQVYY